MMVAYPRWIPLWSIEGIATNLGNNSLNLQQVNKCRSDKLDRSDALNCAHPRGWCWAYNKQKQSPQDYFIQA